MSDNDALRELTRRHFFRACGYGLGTIGLSAILNDKPSVVTGRARLDRPSGAWQTRPTDGPQPANGAVCLRN